MSWYNVTSTQSERHCDNCRRIIPSCTNICFNCEQMLPEEERHKLLVEQGLRLPKQKDVR